MTLLSRLQDEGIRRVGTPKTGFRYVDAQGKAVKGAALERCKALKLPPAWTDVRIHPKESAHLQAIGRDKAGRWQYRYHPNFRNRQEERKYERLIEFAHALPKMRATVDRHLRHQGLGREKVMACILKILSTCFIRPGSQVYADENGSFGIATLRPKHVKVRGDTVEFVFRGKAGKLQERQLRDRQVARIVRGLLDIPGKEVFKYVSETGQVIDIRRRDINQYIKEVMGDRFSAKDFRTWAGTLIAACALARAGHDAQDSRTAQRKKVVEAVKEAAAILGNTPAICRASYIYPSVLSSFERGQTVRRYFHTVEELVEHRQPSLHGSEKALLELLKEEAAARLEKNARSARRRTAGEAARSERARSRTRKQPAHQARRAGRGGPRPAKSKERAAGAAG